MSNAAACTAVDRAISALSKFVEAHPAGQVVIELAARADLRQVVDSTDEATGLAQEYRPKLGSWRKLAPRRKGRWDSSFDYFLDRYRSLTWLVHPSLDVPSFLPGNVAGSGSAVLELGDWDVTEILGSLLDDDRLIDHASTGRRCFTAAGDRRVMRSIPGSHRPTANTRSTGSRWMSPCRGSPASARSHG